MVISSEKSYWLYIHPYVYISVKKSRAILYNTLNGQLLEYKEEPEVLKLINRLNSDRNLYVCKLSPPHITGAIMDFIKQLRQAYIGDIVETASSTTKPIQLKPILSLQRSLEGATTTETQNKRLAKDEIIEYLNTISLYLNDTCDRDCHLCSQAYKQFPFCHKNKKGHNEISLDVIKKLLGDTAGSHLNTLNILGGNILKYSKFRELTAFLNGLPIRKEYFLHYLNIPTRSDFSEFFNHSRSRLNVMIHFPIDPDRFAGILQIMDGLEVDRMFHFAIREESDVDEAEKLTSEHRLEHIRHLPYFDGQNSRFFENNVFLTRESILDSRPSMKEILARTSINPLYFKKIHILSNGSIHTNINSPGIGKLDRSYIFDLLDRELNRGRTWTKTRNNVAPCRHCAFHALCPPISNYEYVLGRYNLCHEVD